MLVGEEEEVLRDSADVRQILNRGVTAQVGVDVGADEGGEVWPHPMLHREPAAVHLVVDHSLEQRHLDVVMPRQAHARRRRPQLLLVACTPIIIMYLSISM